MAMVTYELKPGAKPTSEQLTRIREAARQPISFDDDCPEMTAEQLARFRPANPEARQRWLESRRAHG